MRLFGRIEPAIRSGPATGQVGGGSSAFGFFATFGATFRGVPCSRTTGDLARVEFCAVAADGWPPSPASAIIIVAIRPALPRARAAVGKVMRGSEWVSRSNDISMGWSQNYDPLHGPLST